jgi:hypothetical protein
MRFVTFPIDPRSKLLGGFMKNEEADMWIWPSSNAGLE